MLIYTYLINDDITPSQNCRHSNIGLRRHLEFAYFLCQYTSRERDIYVLLLVSE